MRMNIKSKVNLQRFYNRKALVFVSLLFMIGLVFSSFTPILVNGVPIADVVVKTEVELLNAVKAAPDNRDYVIGLSKDIVLENTLEISLGKNITLVSVGWFLVSCSL